MPAPNPLDHPIAFARPRRLSEITSWHDHIPFAFWLVDVLRPRLFVELGAYRGDSYCAVCQAVDELDLVTTCFAVDTWAGDDHAGFYGPDVLADLRAHHNPLYGAFSDLMHTTFDEALPRFHEGSIDLLHIDGRHGYDDVRRDFESWLPKLSERAVVLLHDTVREIDGFGVRPLVEELASRYAVLEFVHGSGLAAVVVGSDAPVELVELTRLDGSDLAHWRQFFATLGAGVRLLGQVQRDTPSARSIDVRLTEVGAELEAVRAEQQSIREAIAEVSTNPNVRVGRAAQRILRGRRSSR